MITVKYKCQCMIKHREITLAERSPGDLDPMKWMNLMAIEVTIDHRIHSPLCTATKMDEILIPSGENTPVGINPHRN